VKLRLLHAIATMNPAAGGPGEGVRQLTAVNLVYGHKVELVTLDPPDAPWVVKSAVPVHAMGPVGRHGFSMKFLRWMQAHAKNYDMVIVNGVWGFNAFGTWLALRKSKVPYAVFTHGMLDPWFKHRFPLKHLKKWLYWPWGLYPVLRDAAAVFFTCERERILARESFWLYDCNEVVVRYGTSGVPDFACDYRPAFLDAHPSLAGKRLFLFFGRVHPKKGPDLLIRALGILKRDGAWDEENMRLVMAGPADSEYAAELEDSIRKEQLEKSVYWTGMVLGDQKWGAFQASEVFVLPSHQENFGIAVAESLSAGTPVLISHEVNISPEIARDGAGLVDEDNVLGTCRVIKKWLSLPPEGQEAMRTKARQTFLARYTAEVGAKDMQRSIYLILASRKAMDRLQPADPKMLDA
jgi:glycosyltransferase involved in cell wall biosynthesis